MACRATPSTGSFAISHGFLCTPGFEKRLKRPPISRARCWMRAGHDRARGFCAYQGLARFDGYTFNRYGADQGLSERRAVDFLETEDGQYWVDTAHTHDRFEPRRTGAGGLFEVFRTGTAMACTASGSAPARWGTVSSFPPNPDLEPPRPSAFPCMESCPAPLQTKSPEPVDGLSGATIIRLVLHFSTIWRFWCTILHNSAQPSPKPAPFSPTV